MRIFKIILFLSAVSVFTLFSFKKKEVKTILNEYENVITNFSTSIHSKKYQVVHVGSMLFKNKKDIPHAVLMKFNAKRKGWFSKKFEMREISFAVSNIRMKDKKVVIDSINYVKKHKRFNLFLKIYNNNSNEDNGHPLDKYSENYFLKDSTRIIKYKKKLIVRKGDVLDFHVELSKSRSSLVIVGTPEIECKLKLN
ncbi:MAG: hypothetical protein V3V28_13355 [Polaribacter sp.]|uniref:hypothetical protein n=1 Tax=Polaribacter sp. TaxID=1920175 RepID=UPI002F360B7A